MEYWNRLWFRSTSGSGLSCVVWFQWNQCYPCARGFVTHRTSLTISLIRLALRFWGMVKFIISAASFLKVMLSFFWELLKVAKCLLSFCLLSSSICFCCISSEVGSRLVPCGLPLGLTGRGSFRDDKPVTVEKKMVSRRSRRSTLSWLSCIVLNFSSNA